MLGVGIDWAEDFHVVALGSPEEGVIDVRRVEHTPGALDALVARVAAIEPDPAEVRVVLEARHGALVDRLVEAGYVVVPVNPDLVARRRGPAGNKDDPEDARIACLLALDRHERLRPLVPHGEVAGELRSIARDDERASRDERRLLNRLRADLLATFPAALGFSEIDLGAPSVLRLLERWPTAEALASVARAELVAFARECHNSHPERFADRVLASLAVEQFRAPAHLVRAKADTIQLTAAQLLLLGRQRRRWERRMGELLVGASRERRERGTAHCRAEPVLSRGEVYLSFPGMGDRLAGRIAGEIGERPEVFETANALQCYAGKAPITRRSGKSQYVVATRLARNRYLSDAVQQWAFCSLRRSGWAREFYDAQRARNKGHNAAIRALGNRWLEVLWHCLRKGVLYDEAVHVANRNRALGRQPTAA